VVGRWVRENESISSLVHGDINLIRTSCLKLSCDLIIDDRFVGSPPPLILLLVVVHIVEPARGSLLYFYFFATH
jgi:hypothetical protein